MLNKLYCVKLGYESRWLKNQLTLDWSSVSTLIPLQNLLVSSDVSFNCCCENFGSFASQICTIFWENPASFEVVRNN